MQKPYSDNAFWNGIISIGLDVYVKNWNKNEISKQVTKQFILNNDSCQNTLCMIYGYLVAKKSIMAIDEMPVELLSDLECEALDWNSSITGESLTKLMKSIWTMNALLSNEIEC